MNINSVADLFGRMEQLVVLAVVLAGALAGPPASDAGQQPTEAQRAAMREYWRHAPRYGCLACSVYNPAPRAAVVPRNVGSVPVVRARLWDVKGRLACYCADARTIWAADDAALYRIDCKDRRLERAFTVADGLPDGPIYQLAIDGETLWVVTGAGLARLRTKDNTLQRLAEPKFSLARVAAGPAGTLLITDQQAYEWEQRAARFRPLGPYPNQRYVARAAERGFWEFQWRKHWRSLLRAAVVGDNEYYVLAGNTLSCWDRKRGWRVLARDAWQAVRDAPRLWGMLTTGVLLYDPRTTQVKRFGVRDGLSSGRPVGLAVNNRGVYLISEPDFDSRAKRFVGGGISWLDRQKGTWSAVHTIAGTDVSFATAIAADGEDVFVAARLYDRVEQRSLHPGMVSTRRYVPHVSGLALGIKQGGRDWQVAKLQAHKPEFRWVMGQQRRHRRDRIRPQRIAQLLGGKGRIWAVVENFPETYYAGFYATVGSVARRTEGRLSAPLVQHTAELGLAGEHPDLLCLTATHGRRIVLGKGQRAVLGLLYRGETPWVVHEGGVYAYSPAADRFEPVVTERFRAYWQVTAGAATPQAVWFGADAGTISRYDRRTGQFELAGVVPGRRVKRIVAEAGKVWVETTRAQTVLPICVADLPRLPAADVIRYDGKAWAAVPQQQMPKPTTQTHSFVKNANYLVTSNGGRNRLAFVKGVFQPKVLCNDGPGVLWLKVWGAVARLSLDRLKPKAARGLWDDLEQTPTGWSAASRSSRVSLAVSERNRSRGKPSLAIRPQRRETRCAR